MIIEGLKIMLLGMSVVFIMLASLVTMTFITSKVISLYGGLKQPSHGDTHYAGDIKASDKNIAAVISAAIAKFRSR